MKKVRLRIPGSHHASLGAELDLPDNGIPRAYAIFAHCFTCSRNLKSFHVISEILANHGIGILRFDFTGIGDSKGDFSDTNFASDVDDIVAIAEYMAANYKPVTILIGHSMGGTASLIAAGRIPSIHACVTLSAPADPGHVARHFIGKRPEVNKNGSAEISLGGNRFTIGSKFFEDLAYKEDGSELSAYQKPLLIYQSHADEMLSHDHALRIFRHCGFPSSLTSHSEADHLLSKREHAEYVAHIVADWLDAYI
jgi:putative redox protein